MLINESRRDGGLDGAVDEDCRANVCPEEQLSVSLEDIEVPCERQDHSCNVADP